MSYHDLSESTLSDDERSTERDRTENITWNILIQESEAQIKELEDKVSLLRKSLTYFRKQEKSGIQFPKTNHLDLQKIT